jgi:cytochrome c5
LGRNGKQYVAIAAGGTNRFRMLAKTADETSDSLIAFALPDGPAIPIRETTQVRHTPLPDHLSQAELKANAPLPDGPGKDIATRMCTKCHGTAVFARMRMGRVGWEDEVAAMVERGAVGTADEIRALIDYMVKNFGK